MVAPWIGVPDWDFDERVISVGALPHLLLPSNVRRVGLLLQVPGAGDVIVFRHHDIPAPYSGLTISAASGIVYFWYPRHGTTPMLEWWGVLTAGVGNLYLTEIFYSPRPREI